VLFLYPIGSVRDNCEPNDNEAGDTAECPDDVFFEEVEKINDDKKYHLLPTFSFSEDEKQLPILVMDMKSATADWVQKQHNFLEPGRHLFFLLLQRIRHPGIRRCHPPRCHLVHSYHVLLYPEKTELPVAFHSVLSL
jgi:hypothetical protein